jgi:transposase-like protein
MDFPTAELIDEDACYAKLLGILHPYGLRCPRCGSGRLGVHRRHRASVLDHRCGDCRAVFNPFTGIALRKTNRRPSALVLILRGFARGVPTALLARELGCDRMKPLELRHKLRGYAAAGLDPGPLPDPVTEADDCYVDAGGKKSAESLGG